MRLLAALLLAAPLYPTAEANLPRDPGPAAPVLLLQVDAANATWSGNNMTAWPATVGPSGAVLGGCGVPEKGATANGIVGVYFDPAQGDILSFGQVDAVAHDRSFEFTILPARTTGNRQYLWRDYRTPGGQDSDDLAPAYTANYGGGYAWAGVFDGVVGNDLFPGSVGGGWHHPVARNFRGRWNKVLATKPLQVLTYTMSSTDGIKVYRNGTLLGTGTAFTQRKLTGSYIGNPTSGTCSIPDDTGPNATYYRVKVWEGALSATQVATSATDAMTTYSVSAWPNNSVTPVTIWGVHALAWWGTDDPFYLEIDDSTLGVLAMANRVNSAIHLALPVTVAPTLVADENGHRPAAKATTTPSRIGFRIDSVAKALYAAGVATGAVTVCALFTACTGGGQDSTGGEAAAFADNAAATAREAMSVKTTATATIKTQDLSDASSSRIQTTTVDIGTTAPAAVCWTQSETTDIPQTYVNGTLTAGAVVNNGTTTLNTFTWPGRQQNGSYTSNGEMCGYFSEVVVLDMVATQGEMDSWRTRVQANWGAP